MRSKVLSLIALGLLLAACQTAPQQGGAAGGAGAAVQPTSPPTSGGPATTLNAPAPGSRGDFELIGDRVLFDFDKSDLRPEYRARIERWADWLKRYPNVRLTIEGHCDERGTREYNIALGDRRANAAKRYLVSLGIDTNRVTTISYGKERPAVVGSNESAWQQNRRGQAVVN